MLRRLGLFTAAVALIAGCSSDDTSGDAAPQDGATITTAAPETTPTTGPQAVACEDVEQPTLDLIAASLSGPTIAVAKAADVTVDGEDGRLVAVQFPGEDNLAVFVVDATGSVYWVNSMAGNFSNLEGRDLSSAWDEPITAIGECVEAA